MLIRVEIACGHRHCALCHMCTPHHDFGHQIIFFEVPRYFCDAFPGNALEMDGSNPLRCAKCKEQEE